MGAYIGSALANLTNSYGDEKKRREALQKEQERYAAGQARQSTLDQQNVADRLAATEDRRTTLARLQEQMDYTKEKDAKAETEKETDRQMFPEMFKKARAGDEGAMGWVLNRYPQMAASLTRPEPTPRNIDPYSPAGIAAQKEIEGAKYHAPQQEPLVQTQDESGNVVWTPRSQAAGMNAPRAKAGQMSDRLKTQYAAKINQIKMAELAMDGFKAVLNDTGIEVMPGQKKQKLSTAYNNMLVNLKELYNLGVLNGKDLEILTSVIPDPTKVYTGTLGGGADAVKSSVEYVRKFITDRVKQVGDDYGNQITQAGGDPTTLTAGGGGGASMVTRNRTQGR